MALHLLPCLLHQDRDRLQLLVHARLGRAGQLHTHRARRYRHRRHWSHGRAAHPTHVHPSHPRHSAGGCHDSSRSHRGHGCIGIWQGCLREKSSCRLPLRQRNQALHHAGQHLHISVHCRYFFSGGSARQHLLHACVVAAHKQQYILHQALHFFVCCAPSQALSTVTVGDAPSRASRWELPCRSVPVAVTVAVPVAVTDAVYGQARWQLPWQLPWHEQLARRHDSSSSSLRLYQSRYWSCSCQPCPYRPSC